MKNYEFFSELASKNRLDVLQVLDEKPTKFTNLSKEIDMSSAETSRQLNRLRDANLIKKRADGCYCLTLLGKLILSCMSNLNFVSDKSEYFLSHDTSPIPPHLLSQIDALSGGEIVIGVYEALNTVDKLFEGVKDYVCYMSDDFPRYYPPKVEMKLDAGVEFKVIFPDDLITTSLPNLSDKIREGVEFRVLDEVKMLIHASDSFADVGLPGPDGTIDHGALIFGSDSRFREWCKDGFNYYWEKAKPAQL